MRQKKPFGQRVIEAMKECLDNAESLVEKKAKEGMQEPGKDQFVNEKRLQKKTIPSQVRQDKEPSDMPLEIDELSYSKKDKDILLTPTHDSNMASKNKKDIIDDIEKAWKKNKDKGYPFV
jgi:hypothetical protein